MLGLGGGGYGRGSCVLGVLLGVAGSGGRGRCVLGGLFGLRGIAVGLRGVLLGVLGRLVGLLGVAGSFVCGLGSGGCSLARLGRVLLRGGGHARSLCDELQDLGLVRGAELVLALGLVLADGDEEVEEVGGPFQGAWPPATTPADC
ncbi:hypothetical protein [Streptomyces sp. NPDC001153]